MDCRTTSGAIVKSWFDELEQQGIPLKVLQERSGINYADLQDMDARVPLDQHFKLMEIGIELTGNPALALQMGEKSTPERLGVVGHVFMNCPTLREAGNQVIRYSKLICESVYMEQRETEDQSLFILVDETEEYESDQSTEVALASAITWVRQFSGMTIKPIEVRFHHTAPDHLEEYERIFQAPLFFNQPENAIVFEKSVLDYQLPTYNPYLQDILTKHADGLLSQLTSGENLQDQIQEFIFDRLPSGEVDIEMVAHHLNMSRWTLNRKLKEEGTSFQELFKQVRKKLAINYLKRKKFSISEVAFLLGFSEPSTFHRAFKNWEGQSPGEFRKSHFAILS